MARAHVLHGLSLTVEQGTILTLIGRNGEGKTSTLKSSHGTNAESDRTYEILRP